MYSYFVARISAYAFDSLTQPRPPAPSLIPRMLPGGVPVN